MLLTSLFIIPKNQKQLKYPTESLWLGKQWCIYSVEHYAAFKIIFVKSSEKHGKCLCYNKQ